MRLNSLCLLPSSWHSSAGFPYPFAAIARGPLAFATRWIWAADFAESIETAAVRAPLCLRFPLLLSSVQAGVGLLSPPPPPRRGGFILRFSRVWRQLLQLLGLPPRRLPTLIGLRRARAFRQLRPRRAMPRLHGLLSRRIQFSILSSVVAADGRLSRVMRPRRQSVFSGRRLRSRQHRLCPRRDRLQRGLMTLRQLLIGLFSRTVRIRVFVPLWFPFSVQFRLAVGFCFCVALARSVALPLSVISPYEGLHCSCLRSTDSSPAILFEFLALVSCLPTMRFHSLCLLPFLWQSSAGFIFLFAMAVALVPVPQCFYWLRLLPYLWQFSGCDTMRFYSPRPSCSNHLLCLLPSLQHWSA